MTLRPLSTLFVMIGAALPVHAAAQRIPRPDLILTGGRVFTADPRMPWAEAVAIRGDRIVAVGSSATLRQLAGASTRRIELGGRVVVPGFNDAHDHAGAAVYGVAFATSTAPMPDPTLAVVLDSLRVLVARTAHGTWLHSSVGLALMSDASATRATLDRVAPDHPVLLNGWTGHGVILNSAALHALHIPEDIQDPLAGTFHRDAAGRLNGVLDEYAGWDAERRLFSGLPLRTIVTALRQYAKEGLRLGITSVQDMNGFLDPATTVRAMRAARLPIRLRVIPYPMTGPHGRLDTEWAQIDRHPAPLTTISGVKWILDGTPIERGALMRTTYADRPDWHGNLMFPSDTIRAMLVRALATHEPLHLHITGDSVPRLVFGMMRALAPDSVWRPLRVRVEHGDWVLGDLLPMARSLGIVVVANPTHFGLDPDMIRARFGSIPPFMAVRSLVAAGIPLGIGSDGPRNPFVNLMFAITNPNTPKEALTREQAVIAYTSGSAYAEFAERDKGVLAPGMLADLAVLSADIFAVPAAALPATVSVLTLVGGRVAYDVGVLARVGGRAGPPHSAGANRLKQGDPDLH